MTRPRVAIAHDYLTQRGGAERVVLAMLRAFPDATVHTLLYDPDATFPEFRRVPVVTSPINRVSLLRRHHRLGLPALASASSRMTVDADVTIVSTSGWAHGFRSTGRSLVYCYNPARWLYQAHDYVGDHPLSLANLSLTVCAPPLRRWDAAAMRRHEHHVAISSVVRERMRATYDVEAELVFPPVTVSADGPRSPIAGVAPGYHLVVSRLMPYKNVDKAVDAFRSLPGERLLVIGSGPEEHRLRHHLPANVTILPYVPDEELRWAYASCVALLAPSLEDFGLTPLEAGVFGKPTLALRAGGYLDTVADGVNGAYFAEPTPAAIAAAVCANRPRTWNAGLVAAHGERFSESRFRTWLVDRVDDLATQPAAGVRHRQP